jgi:hypothetical protein
VTALAFVLFCWCGAPGIVQPAAAPAATVRPLSTPAERALRVRVLSWWSARVGRDHQRLYALFEPAYRQRVTFVDFLKESAVRTRYDLAAPSIDAVVAEAVDRVRVVVSIESRPPRLPAGRVTTEDSWVRVSGHWYKVHQDIVYPFTVER